MQSYPNSIILLKLLNYLRNTISSAIKLLWYHYHPAMPYLEEKIPEIFRKESIRLEHEPSDWRGFFLCSAFVVEAVKKQR